MDNENINLDWHKLDDLKSRSFPTDKQYNIIVKRESLPIVFVPGIMGSRLHVGDDLVWDPNNTYGLMHGLARRYGFASPADRKKWLITSSPREVIEYAPGKSWETIFQRSLDSDLYGRPAFDWLPMPKNYDNFGANMNEWQKTAPAILSQQGWCQVAWGFYGSFLFDLARHAYGDYMQYFMFPVYAVGYDWVADNRIAGHRLVQKITDIVNKEHAKPDRFCEKVILVSHSMGGLVTRAANLIDASKILGIIHGAQPVTGAPAAYRRMRAGFESDGLVSGIQSYVMGAASDSVMPVLANCPGGLELLPTTAYKDDRGSSEWLMRFGHSSSNQPVEQQPQGNVYEGIYNVDPQQKPGPPNFLRLIFNAELLAPSENSGGTSAGRSTAGNASAFTTYQGNLTKAASFHRDLGLSCHEYTFHMWVKGAKSAFHQVRFRYAHPGDYKEVITTAFPEGGASYTEVAPDQGSGVDLDPAFDGGKGAYFQIDPPDKDMGDGTVPRSSGSALKDSPHIRGTCTVDGSEHSAFYQNEDVRKATHHFIERLADLQKSVRLGQLSKYMKNK